MHWVKFYSRSYGCRRCDDLHLIVDGQVSRVPQVGESVHLTGEDASIQNSYVVFDVQTYINAATGVMDPLIEVHMEKVP